MTHFCDLLTGILSTDLKNVSIDIQSSVVLQCRVAGYEHLLSTGSNLIEWRFKDHILSFTDKYFISVVISSCPPYGVCLTSHLIISSPNRNDVGSYTCAFEDLTQTITLIEGKL